MTRKENPADFVSAFGTMTTDGLTAVFAFWFPNDYGEIIQTSGTGSGKVNSHAFNLALPLGALNTGVNDQVKFFEAFDPEDVETGFCAFACSRAASRFLTTS
jgi:hypothetical protein